MRFDTNSVDSCAIWRINKERQQTSTRKQRTHFPFGHQTGRSTSNTVSNLLYASLSLMPLLYKRTGAKDLKILVNLNDFTCSMCVKPVICAHVLLSMEHQSNAYNRNIIMNLKLNQPCLYRPNCSHTEVRLSTRRNTPADL